MEMSTDRIVAIIAGVFSLVVAGGSAKVATDPEECKVWVQQLTDQAERWHDELERTRRYEEDRCESLVRHACD